MSLLIQATAAITRPNDSLFIYIQLLYQCIYDLYYIYYIAYIYYRYYIISLKNIIQFLKDFLMIYGKIRMKETDRQGQQYTSVSYSDFDTG